MVFTEEKLNIKGLDNLPCSQVGGHDITDSVIRSKGASDQFLTVLIRDWAVVLIPFERTHLPADAALRSKQTNLSRFVD